MEDASNFVSTTAPAPVNGGGIDGNGGIDHVDAPEISAAPAVEVQGAEQDKPPLPDGHSFALPGFGHDKPAKDRIVDLAATKADLERWPIIKKGYSDLFLWLVFFGLYCAVLMIQLRVSKTYAIDEALRSQVVDEGGALQDVSTLGDFFDYLDETIRPAIFPPEWYNGEPLTTDETGFVLYYNMLVGGLLVVQKRGISTSPCRVPMYTGANSSYQDFYEVCYPAGSGNYIWDDIPEADREPKNENKVPWAPGVPAPPDRPVDVTATKNDPALGNFWTAFTYDSEYEGFATFLALADGAKPNEAKIKALKTYRWLDKHTREISIKFALYNGMLQMFTFCVIDFGFDRTGTFIPYNRVGGTKVTIKTIDMEPYLGNKFVDRVQIALEVILVVWIFYQISSFVRTGLEILVRDGWKGKAEVDALGVTRYIGGFKNFLSDKWTIVDLANYGLFVYYIIMRVDLVRTILHEDNIIQVPANSYKPILEKAKVMVENQLLGNFFNILLCLGRCFKFYRFQPRLAIINKTMEACFSDLYHFLLMFVTFLFGFGVMSNVLFGPQLPQFSNLSESLMTGWMMMNGAGLAYHELAYVDGSMAGVFFIAFMFLVFIILLNVLLAILVDSYALAKDATVDEYGGDEDAIPSIAGDFGTIIRHSLSFGAVSNTVLKQAVEHLLETGEEQSSVDQIFQCIPEKVRNRSKITHEKILKNGGLHMVEEGEEEEEERIEELDLEEPDLNAILAQGNLDPTVTELLRKMDDLLLENKQLQRRVDAEVKAGNIKAKNE